MKLNLYCSNTANSAAEGAIDRLGKNLTPDSRHIFIVPDRFTVTFEKKIFERLELPGAVNIDVLSFSRLAVKELKHKAKRCLTQEGAALILKKVIDKNKESLKRYRKAANSVNFAKEMLSVISSLRNSGVKPEDLENAASGIYKGTAEKAKDIALLYRTYDEELKERYDDRITRLDRLSEAVKDSATIRESHIYIAGFNGFSSLQYRIIEEMIKAAPSVNIAITPTNNGKNQRLFPCDIKDRLIAISEKLCAPVEVVELFSVLKEPFKTIYGELFSFASEKGVRSGDKLRLYRENTVYDEINGIAREIFRLVKSGYRYKDIAVINCNQSYSDIIVSIFKRYGIPFFIDWKYKLSDTAAARYLIAALETVIFNYRADKTLAFIKNPLFGISYGEACDFENYVLKYNVNYAGFCSPFKYGDEGGRAEAVRKILAGTLGVFNSRVVPSEEFFKDVRTFIGSAAVKDRLDEFLSGIKGEEMLIASNSQALKKLIEITEEIGGLLEGVRDDAEGHLNILKASISASEISLIPQFADSVFIGSLNESCLDKIKALFVISAAADALPSPYNFGSVISAADYGILESSGIRLYPSPEDLIREEQLALLDLFSKVSDRVYIGYSAVKPDGQECKPSPVFKELEYMTDAAAESLNARYSIFNIETVKELEESAVNQDNAFFEYLTYCNRVPVDNVKASLMLDILYSSLAEKDKRMVEKLMCGGDKDYIPPLEMYFHKDADGCYLTKATELESFFRCPYKHHLTYGIRLKEREEAALQVADIGIIIHKALELFFKKTKGILKTISPAQCSDYAGEALNEAFQTEIREGVNLDALGLNILDNIRREFRVTALKLYENQLNSRFEPAFIEAGFGYDDSPFPAVMVKTEDAVFKLRGRIDRVDLYGKNAAVIDFKTGAAGASVSDLYYGVKIQLYVYLKALSAAGYIPCAAFYLPLTDSYKKTNDYAMTGQLISENEIIDAFDVTLFEAAAVSGAAYSKHIPVKLTLNSNNEAVPGKSGSLLEREKFNRLINYIDPLLVGALEDIKEGCMEKSPIESLPCYYCQYKIICRGEGLKKLRPESSKTPLTKEEDNGL